MTYYDMAENKGNAELYLLPAEGGDAVRLTTTAAVRLASARNGARRLAEIMAGFVCRIT